MTIAPTDPMVPSPWSIRRVRRDTHDTFTLELEGANGRSHLPFVAGQFNMLYTFGVGEVPISMSGDPAKTHRLVHTIRAVGTVTNAMSRLKRGDTVGVRGPYGSSWPVAEAEGRDVVLVAGGIGLAPLRPVVYHVLTNRETYGRVVLLYGTRSSRDLLFLRELERWRGRLDMDVEVTLDTASGDWRGNVGVVTRLIPRAPFNPKNAVAMICGPEVMMRFTVQELQKRGVDDRDIYLSLERNMKCAIGFCGHCQFGPTFMCKEGPVFSYDQVAPWLRIREV